MGAGHGRRPRRLRHRRPGRPAHLPGPPGAPGADPPAPRGPEAPVAGPPPGPGAGKATWRRWAAELPPPGAAPLVVEHLRRFLNAGPGLVGAYEALPGEVDLAPLLADLDAVALPRIDGDHVTWHRDDGRREPHRFGLGQPPADAEAVDPVELDVLLVPGRLFDRRGTRLGRGGGHYDRLLPHLRAGTPAVGVTTDDRVVPVLPAEAHDVPMTHLATESGVRVVRGDA